MIDAVLSYHMNSQTCGVAKFNHELAKRLGVPCRRVEVGSAYVEPLVSVKPSEIHEDGYAVNDIYGLLPSTYDLLLHGPIHECALKRHARRVFYAEKIGCPSTIDGNSHRGAYRVLVFGMAHKLNLPHFAALKERLDAEHPDYTIELSTAVHEGNPWHDGLAEAIAAMRQIFGSHLRVLGFLGDDALAKELRDVDAVAAYFQPALRANNTSYWAAVDAGKTIYTNRDDLSPKDGDPAPTWDALVELIRG